MNMRRQVNLSLSLCASAPLREFFCLAIGVAALLAAWAVPPASVGRAIGQILRGGYGNHTG